MSAYFADIDAVCSTLGWMDGDVYKMDPEAVQGLKHLIWILKQDRPAHECRRYIGGKRIVQTDLIPMVISNFDKPDVVDVLLRLLVNLSFPTLLLYNGNYPKDAAEQRKFIRLMEICEEYKEAFSLKSFWSVLGDRLEKILHTDWALRSEADGLIIERILVLIRNVLQVPANVEREKRFDNDASQHDCLLWALHQAGILDIILYILGSPHENRFLIHTLEILSLAYREQSAVHLADATLQRTNAEKKTDEQLLIKARQKTAAAGATGKPPTGRHSRFRGTYTYNNVKSISDSDAVCHQSLEKIIRMDFSSEKSRQKVNFRNVKEKETFERKSIFSVRLFLREYCMEILRVYNNIVRQARRYLNQHGSSTSEFHDDSYLLWAIRFFLEFNRHSGFKIELVSESLNIDTFHWAVTRMDTYTENIATDKTRKSIWARRLHLTVQTYRELLNNMHALEKIKDTSATELLSLLQNNIFYVVEYRETTLQLLTNFKESLHTRAYLRDVVEVAHLFFSMLQRFCKGTVRVQERVKTKRKKAKKQPRKKNTEEEEGHIEMRWLQEAPTVASLLENGELKQQELPTPFDSTSSVPIEEQKGDCLKSIHTLLRKKNYEQAIKMLYAARTVWTTSTCFGSETATPDEDLLTLQEIFTANLSSGNDGDENDGEAPDDSEEEDELEESEGIVHHEEKDFKFEEFSKRLVDHRVVYACTTVLTDWEKIKTTCLKAAVTLLYRVCVEHKMPSMLFQVSLLRIFQAVLNSIDDEHSRELRRLAIYTVRQLQQKVLTGAVDDGGLLFAELLFAKTSRSATAMEIGYDEAFNDYGRKSSASQKAWTEEQEQELQRLFMENQTNPQSDKDVIDWLLENLIDQTRTRRAVMKKLKEMGLIFKAPTKKSNANRQQKMNGWTPEEDEKLGELYDELRMEKNPLKSIGEAFGKKFTRPAIARRMVSLGLIADVGEIMPSKRRTNRERLGNGSDGNSSPDEDERNSNSSDNDEEEEEEMNQSINKHLNEALVKKNLRALGGGDMKEAVKWIVECFEEVRSLYEDSEPADDNEEGVPMIPIAPYQTAALKKPEFKRLLASLGVMDTGKRFIYHRIPLQLTSEELKKRMDILNAYCEAPTADEEEELGERSGISPPSGASEDEMDTTAPTVSSKRKAPSDVERRSMSPLIVSEDDLADEDRPAKGQRTISPSGNEEPASTKRNRSESSDSEAEMSLLQRKKKNKRAKAATSKEQTSVSQLIDSDDEVEVIVPKQTRLVISDDESDTEVTSKQAPVGASSQRDRSDSSASELPSEEQNTDNRTKVQKVRRRAAVISSDEE